MFTFALKKMAPHPIAVASGSFVLFLSGFALSDFNKAMELTDDERKEFQLKNPAHLGQALAQLHTKAFFQRLTYDSIKVNRNRSIELFFLYKRAEKKKQKLKEDALF